MTEILRAVNQQRAEHAVRMLRLRDVIEITGLKRDSIYRLAAAGKFPRPRKLSERASAWNSREIQAWIESRPVATSQPAA
jgi:prophage regulatory protein